MWMWILIGLDIITKVHGFSSGLNPESCGTLSPQHQDSSGGLFTAQTSAAPFAVEYEWNSNPEDPITVVLRSTQSTMFEGFMLEAREAAQADSGPPIGRFIPLETNPVRLLTCSGLADSAVSQRNNQDKVLIRVNWTATEIPQDIVFRATFVQSFVTFWENVRANLSVPTTTSVPSTTTNPPEQSTTTIPPTQSPTLNTQEVSTTTNTAEPSTTTNTAEPSTTTNTPAPTTTTNTADPSTTTNTADPSTTTNTAEPSNTTNTPATSSTTTKQSTTESSSPTSTVTNATLSSTTLNISNIAVRRLNREERVASALMCVDCMLEEAKMEMSNIIAVSVAKGPLYQRLGEASKIAMSTLCLGVEIASLVLFCAGDSSNVVLVGLACAVIAINFLEQVMWSLRIRDKLKQICCIAVKVDFVVHQSFTLAILYVAVLVDWRGNRCEPWPLKVLIALTAWIFLAVVWILVFSTQKKAIRKTVEQVALNSGGTCSQKGRKKNRIAAKVAVIAISVSFVLGTTSLAIAVIVGIVGCQEN